MLPSPEIRRQFIDFFVKKHGHTFAPSSPVVPHGDPTLLFANAGMNQFKDVFLGTGSRPYKRAANTQKCIRAGGKHNDLDDVGKDTYHHTFFEMLGNWSFGDYFKAEAIAWAWELLTDVWKMDPSRLHVTVFEGDAKNGIPRDDEAATFWREAGVPPERIHLGNAKDNFWEMGETGPCGPCTEVHIDLTPDQSGGRLVNAGTPEVIEIWNLVFIQFNRNADRSLTPLPARHVDTGMGFERVAAVLQGKTSNYDTDVFTPLISEFGALTGAAYGATLGDIRDVGFRVVADHLRMASFAIADGARPGTNKRDSVLRSVIRRAVRFGYQYFDRKEPFLFRLLPTLVAQTGDAFPELKQQSAAVERVLRDEEAEFFKTVRRGILLFQRASEAAGAGVIPGDTAADLHTTYGFPVDLTRQMAAERGQSVDEAGYVEAIRRHKEVSGKDRKQFVVSAIQGDLPHTADAYKFRPEPIEASVVGWVQNNAVIRSGLLQAGDAAALLLDRTNFYAEQGGQVGDTGTITADGVDFELETTQRLGDAVLHVGTLLEGTLKPGQNVMLAVTPAPRLDVMRNHTATHMLNRALREVLGDHVDQRGSLVDADKTRFDFTHPQPLTPEEVARVEQIVNEGIQADAPVTAETMPLTRAKQIPGVRAVFGEKYPDPVRVVLIGPASVETATAIDSVEFCGGTHLQRTGQAGVFKIISQESVAKGVRRITAVTGRRAWETVRDIAHVVNALAGRLNCKPDELPARVEALQDEVKKLQAQVKKGAAGDLAGAVDALFDAAESVGGAKLIVGELPAAPVEAMRAQVDRLRSKAGDCVIVLGWSEDGKVSLLSGVSDALIAKGVEAGKLVGEAAKVVGGKGGGRKDLAQAGGKEPAKLGEALDLARKSAAALMSQ